MPVHDMNIARASALSLYMTRTTPYVNTMAGSAISGAYGARESSERDVAEPAQSCRS